MTTEANKTAMERFTEFINTASEQLAAALISPDAVFHVPGRAEPMRGPAGYLAIIGMMRGGFPMQRFVGVFPRGGFGLGRGFGGFRLFRR